MKYPKILFFSLIPLCIGLLCSCSITPTPPQSIAYYFLDYDKPAMEMPPVLPVTLSVEKFRTAAPYNSNRIVYSKNRYSQGRYVYHQWITLPDEMVTRLLVRDLAASKRFQAVVDSNDPHTSHLLNGTIDEFYEQDTDSQWSAVLSITITLIDKQDNDKTKRFLFQKNYKKIQPMDQKNPKGLTRALSMALPEISRLIISDIYDELQQIP